LINQSDTPTEGHGEKQGAKGGVPCYTPISALLEYSKRWNENGEKRAELMRVLCHLVTERPEQAARGFTSREMVDAFKEATGKAWNFAETESKVVSRYWKKLDELMEKKRTGLMQHLNSLGLDAYPVFVRTHKGGGAGNESRYSIELRTLTFTDSATPIDHGEVPQGQIQYVCEDVAGLKNLLTRRWRLQSVALVLLLSALLICLYLLFAVAMSTHIFSAGQTLVVLLLGFIIPASLWSYFGHLLLVHERKITPVSSVFQSVDKGLLLELKQATGQRNDIKLVKYSGECPICGGRVTAQSGGMAFFGRIVGKCENAPVEHIFSFDHVTRKGRPLR